MNSIRRWCACRSVCYAMVALLPLLGAWLYIGVYDRPLPESADEYGYLLAADTFSKGRLTNPQHPHWVHFEAYHIFHEPTYMTKYPPAQGMVLSLGQRLGDPLYGVWIGIVLMAVSVLWMLRALVPPHWALLGAVLCAVQLSFYHYWAQSFWGGAVAATGGALVIGGARRLWSAPRAGASLACGLGVVLLMFSRPFESIFFVALPAVVFLAAWRKAGWAASPALLKLVLPAAVVFLAGVLFHLHYNARLTGDPFQYYYTHYEKLYPGFRPGAPAEALHEFRHERMARYVRDHLNPRVETRDRWWRTYLSLTKSSLDGILGPILGFVLLFGVLSRVRSWTFFSLAILLIVSTVFIVNPLMFNLHYIAPVTGLLFYVSVQGLRRISLARVGGRRLGPAALACLAILFLIAWVDGSRAPSQPLGQSRQHIIERLEDKGGEHLVVVHYLPDFRINVEFVYNSADIDEQTVIWAQDLGSEENQPLLDYYGDRAVWLLTVGATEHRLEPYKEVR